MRKTCYWLRDVLRQALHPLGTPRAAAPGSGRPSSPAFGSVLGSADATRQAARYTYDDQSRLTAVAQLGAPGSSTTVANYTYNADGLLQGVEYPATANE